MRVKKMLAAVAAAGVVATLAACGGSSGGAGGDDELTVWMLTLEGSQKTAMDTLVSDFEAAHEGVTVKVETRSTDAHKDALRQVAGTDSGPDVYWYWEGPGLGGELVEAGLSKDLTAEYEKYGWGDRFGEATLSNITRYGGYHGVPFTQQAEAIYYNKELFAKAGVTAEPTTYAELEAAAAKIKAAGITPIEFGGTVNWHVMRLLDSLLETNCGSETFDQLVTAKTSWDTDCVGRSFDQLKTWGGEYLNEGFQGVSNDESSQLFYTGEAAMAYEGTWFDSQVVDNGMDPANVGIFKFPTGTDRLYGFGEGFYINAATKKADQAAEFLDFITSTEEQKKVVGVWSPISVNTAVTPATDNPLHELWPPLYDAAKGFYLNNDQNLTLAQTTEYWRIMNSVLTGETAPADAGAQMQKFIESES
ncbi:ABC transporter substrate-binding protein [Quadrisphaera setariae]|nr:extracellular solute-binding protein [Quadrisphaera setariae]